MEVYDSRWDNVRVLHRYGMFLKVKLVSDGGGPTPADGVQPRPAIGPCSDAIAIFIVNGIRD